MAGMKRLFLTLIAIACISTALPAQTLPDSPQPIDSSSSEWNNVAALPHDEEIVVKTTTGRSDHCLFSGAIDTTLFCGPYLSRGEGGEYRFPRSEVQQVRLNQARRNVRIVFWSMVAAGFIWGVSEGPSSDYKDAPRVLVGAAGGAAGALAGAFVSIPVGLLIPGHLVYHRPKNAALPSSTQHTHHFSFRSAQ